MKTIWFKKIHRKHTWCIYNVNYTFLSMLIISFSFIVAFNDFTPIATAEKKNLIYELDLEKFAFYSMYIDESLPDIILSTHSIRDNFLKNKNILKYNKPEILLIWKFFIENKSKYIWLFWDYNDFYNFMIEIYPFREEIFSLLWENKIKKYIVLFENSSEKRPNWWFYGSFAELSLSPTHFNIDIKDSYEIDFIWSWYTINWPERLADYVWTNEVWFIAWNKTWITDIDWKNITKIYEDVTKKRIDWVIFVKSDLFKKYIFWFDDKLLKWEFINANSENIDSDSNNWKKEKYLNDINKYIFDRKEIIFKSFLKNYLEITSNWYIDLYIPSISDNFNKFIVDNNLKSVYKENNILLYDTNISWNKSDKFVQRISNLYDNKWNLIRNIIWDEIDISTIPNWTYKLDILYSYNRTNSYYNKILELENNYWISMTDRENYILWLKDIYKSRALIYFPKYVSIRNISWDSENNKTFETKFSNNITYETEITRNNSINKITLDITINK